MLQPFKVPLEFRHTTPHAAQEEGGGAFGEGDTALSRHSAQHFGEFAVIRRAEREVHRGTQAAHHVIVTGEILERLRGCHDDYPCTSADRLDEAHKRSRRPRRDPSQVLINIVYQVHLLSGGTTLQRSGGEPSFELGPRHHVGKYTFAGEIVAQAKQQMRFSTTWSAERDTERELIAARSRHHTLPHRAHPRVQHEPLRRVHQTRNDIERKLLHTDSMLCVSAVVRSMHRCAQIRPHHEGVDGGCSAPHDDQHPEKT